VPALVAELAIRLITGTPVSPPMLVVLPGVLATGGPEVPGAGAGLLLAAPQAVADIASIRPPAIDDNAVTRRLL
jgi:hypothetical protein